ncbi:uncharacterized protein LOC6550190 isoform X2 [Drosophila erecta]|uniref:uncharacterized protein LOC6550190 isoform X2 n=1 Tax=Drosophila erecta TaxID=7220 RepID=UPI000F05CB8D|nr:uncharacterized protein LOC6550190 isoform X2 [Drosophila erecta]
MEKYPLAKELIGKFWLNDAQMAQLEEELKKRQELNAEEQQPQLEQMLFDLMLAKQCALEAKDNCASLAQANTIMQDCIFQILQIEELLGMTDLQDILYRTVHCMEQELQNQMKMDEDLAEHEDHQNTILESRSIVQEFRKQQASKEEAEKELASVEELLGQSDRQWTIMLRSMTDNRNKKIVSILQMSKLIDELEEQWNNTNFIKTDVTGGHIDINEDRQPKIASLPFDVSNNTSPFQSASDFLKNYIIQYIRPDDNEVRTKKLETPLRSILANRREDEYVATKQVRFSPYLKINHIEKEKSEIQDWLSHSGETDDQNGELEEDAEEIEATDDNSEEVSEEELAKASGDELEEASDEVLNDEMEAEDEGYEEKVQIEMSEKVLDPEQDGYDEKSGSEMEASVSDYKESGGEASGEEEPDDVGKQVNSGEKTKPDEQKSNEISDKPEIIRVDILSPMKNISSWVIDNIPTTSTGTLNSYTASQLLNYGIYFNEPPPSKRLKLDEDEFPMAQPMPEFLNNPTPTYNNVDDQSLLFSSPHNNFDDDYLLNFSDDNDPTPAGSSYIL